MAEQAVAAWPAPFRIAGEAYGVRVRISTDSPEVLARLQAVLPPDWTAFDPQSENGSGIGDGIPEFSLMSATGIEYVLKRDQTVLARTGLEVALGVFDAKLRAYIAERSPNRIFVHAGVVGHRDRAIVIPGPSFSGKTTLVASLVQAGALYYSDEYAVLDDRGLVHPYPRPLSIRSNEWTATDHHASSLGGTTGEQPLPLGLVVVTQYRSGAVWQPRVLSSGETVLSLLANTVPAQERPEETMTALSSVVDGSGVVTLEGERGDARDIVEELLERVPA